MVKISELNALTGEIPLTMQIEALLVDGTPVRVTMSQMAELIRDTVFAALVQAGVVTITQDDNANTITISATGGGGGGGVSAAMHPGYLANTAYPSFGQSQSGSGTPSPDLLMLIPIIPRFDVVLSALLLRISTAAAGGKVKACLYANNGGSPAGGAKIADATTELPLDTNHTVPEITFATAQTVQASNPRWLGLLMNVAGQTGGAQFYSQAPADPRAREVFGSDPGAFNIGNVTAMYTAAQSYDGGFPPVCPAVTRSVPGPPMVWFRKA